jgi:hypothetical protein
LEDPVTARRKLICAALALSLILAAGGSPCLAEPAPPHARPAQQPAFCFQGAAPDRQELSRYAERTRQDAARVSTVKAGDRDDTAFVIMLVVFAVAVAAGGVYLASQGI